MQIMFKGEECHMLQSMCVVFWINQFQINKFYCICTATHTSSSTLQPTL